MKRERSQSHSPEETGQTVDRFIEFTKKPFEVGEENENGVIWVDQMDRIYGNEELMRTGKNEAYKGIEGIRDILLKAYGEGGLGRLKSEFLMQVRINTDPSVLPTITPFFKAIYPFE